MKDCNNCQHHDQARPFPPICTDCLSEVTHDNLNLKNWAPLVVEGVMSQEEYRAGILSMSVGATKLTDPRLYNPCAEIMLNGREFYSTHDDVKSPAHYMLFPDMESIEAIRELLTAEEYAGFLKGNVLKYRFRAGRKGDSDAKTLQDIQKSEAYSRFLALAE